MLTFKQWCVSKRKVTQAQRAQIPDIEKAKSLVMQAIEEALVLRRSVPDGLLDEDLDRIFNHQPVHFDGLGYVPHWFEKQDIKQWGQKLGQKLQIAMAGKKVQQTLQDSDT
jgi:hypothetical protein